MNLSTENKEIPLWVIGGDIKLDEIMHVCDMFENFKVLINFEPLVIKIMLKDGEKLSEERFKLWVDTIKNNKLNRIVAIFIPFTNYIWKDETVKVVSNGKSWAMFDDYLKFLVIEIPAFKI